MSELPCWPDDFTAVVRPPAVRAGADLIRLIPEAGAGGHEELTAAGDLYTTLYELHARGCRTEAQSNMSVSERTIWS
ncbi:hypothetical protein ACIBH1_42045 [Nonomuraea sp. NPDC050663]|uniref:hypothetical protein n=1 Tax=Nonomuraea sp. NPDC050663 TaxID=3364370 RepID=UPI00378E1B29